MPHLITNLLGEHATNGSNRRGGRRYPYVLIFSLAGLLSALATASLVGPFGKSGELLGGVFAVIITTSLWVSGASRRIFGGTLAIIVITAAYSAAVVTAGEVELGLPWKTWSMGSPPGDSPVSLFAGGIVGSLLVLGAVFLAVPLRERDGKLQLACLLWPVLGGLLGVIGWALGPYLGIATWYIIHSLGLRSFSDTSATIGYGDGQRFYSLYVVWQTGMGLALGFMLDQFLQRSERQ